MNLAVGQVYERIEGTYPESVVVLQVRDEHHPRGHGKGYGDTGIAVRVPPHKTVIDPASVHPFDITILCAALPSHGPERWRLATAIHYEPLGDGKLYSMPGPWQGDE